MLLTKIHIPSPGKNLVHRSVLFEKLNEGLNRKLILISAPAGFGKTTLICDWIKQQHIKAAWFSIDRKDDDMADFLTYLISSIQYLHKDIGQKALELIRSPGHTASEAIITLLINDMMESNQDLLVILDDFHLISNPEIPEAVSYLLEYMPENLHLAILTRSDPNLQIAKLRSQNLLIELRSSDLNFSANEISVLFNKKLNNKLSNKSIQALENKTEGWIAGLQLAAISMQGYKDTSAFIEDFEGNNRYIMDYLIEEVLKIQPDEIKEFLLRTSILKHFSASLCNHLLERNDSHLILEDLERNNMFVFLLDTERKWYRYHHLFADLLKQRLLLKDKKTITELHNKASVWFEENEMTEQAIEHTLEIGNYGKAIDLLGKSVESMWENGLHSAILNYGNEMPDDIIKRNAQFCLYYAWILIASGKIVRASQFLLSAEETITENSKDERISKQEVDNIKKLSGKIAVAFAYLNSHEEHSEKVFDYCRQAMDNLTEDDPFWFSWAWFSYAVSYFSIGKLQDSKTAFEKAFEYGKKSGNIYLISTIVIRMAENEQQLGQHTAAYKRCTNLLKLIEDKGYAQITKAEWTYASLYFILGVSNLLWANMELATEYIKIAFDLSRIGKDLYSKIFITMVYSYILEVQGDAESEKVKRDLETLMTENEAPPFLKSMFIGWKIYTLIEQNEYDKAEEIISENNLGLDKEKNYSNELSYVSIARLLIKQGRLKEAELLMDELYELVSSGRRIERMIELKCMYALCFKIKFDQEKALKSLIEAMELASDENLVSYFAFSSDPIDDLIESAIKLQASGKTKISKEFIALLKGAISKKEKQKKIYDDPDISARELDTLKLIAENLTNQEIADKLFISLNTVKTHLKNIYMKLDVDSRTKAVERARERGII